MATANKLIVKIICGILFLIIIGGGAAFYSLQIDDLKRTQEGLRSELTACQGKVAELPAADGNGQNTGGETVTGQEQNNVLGTAAVPAEQAVKKAVDYVNKNMLSQGTTATSQNTAEVSGLYEFSLTVEGKDYEAYVSKDGKLFFAQGIPQAIKLDEPVTSASQNTETKISKTAKPDIQVFSATTT